MPECLFASVRGGYGVLLCTQDNCHLDSSHTNSANTLLFLHRGTVILTDILLDISLRHLSHLSGQMRNCEYF